MITEKEFCDKNNIKDSKNIWYFHHYATPPSMSGLARPSFLGKKIVEKGNKVSVFAASYLHYSNENIIKDNRKYIIDKSTELNYIFIKTPSSIKGYGARIINMFIFYKRLYSVTKKYKKETGKPDIIIASSPHPLTMIAGIKISRKLGIPCICEIRDFWPEVFFMGGVLRENSLIGKILLKGENWIYKKADAMIFLKEGDTEYIKEKKWDLQNGGNIDLEKCYYINNGVDCKEFRESMNKNKIKDEDLDNEKFKIVYTGAIRPVNNIDNILDAAKLLKDRKNIEFLVYGTGNQVERLKKRIEEEKIENLKMKGYVEKKYIPYILSKASVNILNYSSTKYNWKRGNSSNKIFEYMASGKPIISTIQMGYCPLKKYECGITVDECTAKGLANAIKKILDMPKDDYYKMCNNAKEASNEYDYKKLSEKLENVIKITCDKYNCKGEINERKDKSTISSNRQ